MTYTVPFAGNVVENREILLGDQSITSVTAQRPRDPGEYTSTHKIRIGEGTAPGNYTLRASLRLLGSGGNESAEATAAFEIR